MSFQEYREYFSQADRDWVSGLGRTYSDALFGHPDDEWTWFIKWHAEKLTTLGLDPNNPRDWGLDPGNLTRAIKQRQALELTGNPYAGDDVVGHAYVLRDLEKLFEEILRGNKR